MSTHLSTKAGPPLGGFPHSGGHLHGVARPWPFSAVRPYRIDSDDPMQGNLLRVIKANRCQCSKVENMNGEPHRRNSRRAVRRRTVRLCPSATARVRCLTTLAGSCPISFQEDLESAVRRLVPEPILVTNWADPERDLERRAPVDYWVQRAHTPLAMFALPNDGLVMDTTITLLQLEKWRRRLHSNWCLRESRRNPAPDTRPIQRYRRTRRSRRSPVRAASGSGLI